MSNEIKFLIVSKVLVENGDKILLIKRATGIDKDKWDAPGGILEKGETPEQCAIREVKEETGLDIEITSFLGYEYHEKTRYKNQLQHGTFLYYKGIPSGGKINISNEVSEYKWISLKDLANHSDLRPIFIKVLKQSGVMK